jgi:hypothetical protein
VKRKHGEDEETLLDFAGHTKYMVAHWARNPSMKSDFAQRKTESRRPARRGGSSRAVGFFLISLAFVPKVRTMKLSNPLVSLSWLSSLRRSRRRPRRLAPVFPAAEILEVRSLLSGNVVAAVNGTALTLTSDSGDNAVDVFRLNATTVEIDGIGTTINGAASQTFALSSVSGITVNLGSGFDIYEIFSRSGSPALNIGAGGVLFQGAAGGGMGDQLFVVNDSSSAMTIGGSVTVQGSTFHSALAHSGSNSSIFNLFTNGSGNLTVLGSVFASQSSSGSGDESNQVDTNGAGNLTVLGSVFASLSSSGSGKEFNDVLTFEPGNLKVFGSVTEIVAGPGTGSRENSLVTEGAGNLTVGLSVFQSATGGSGVFPPDEVGAKNSVETGPDQFTGADGSIVIGGAVSQTGSSTGGVKNLVKTEIAGGNITISFGVTQNATSSGGNADNEVNAAGSHSIRIGTVVGGVTQTATSNALTAENFVEAEGSGNVTIGNPLLGVLGGSVNQTAFSSGSATAFNNVITKGSGNITIAGSVAQSASVPGSDSASNFLEVDDGAAGNIQIGGAVTQTASAGDFTSAFNYIKTFGDGNVTIKLGATQSASAGVRSSAFNLAFSNAGGFVAIGAGPLGGSLKQTASAGDDSSAHNDADDISSGNLRIGNALLGVAGGSLFQTASAGREAYNKVISDVGNVAIAGPVWQSASAGADSQAYNFVEDDGSGNITIGGGVRQTALTTGEDGNAFNYVITRSTGNISIGFGPRQTATGDDKAANFVEADGNISTGGNIAIGASVVQTATLTESDDDDGKLLNDVAAFSFGNITIRGGVSQTASSDGELDNQVDSETAFGGAIHVAGLIVMKSTTTGTGDFGSRNEVFADGGSVSALGVMITDSGSQPMLNVVFSESSGALQIGPGGVTINGSGSAFHGNEIFATPGATVRIAGSVVVTDTTTGSGNEVLEIDGDTIIGGALLVTMNGPKATIHINDIAGFGTVEVKGLFSATMLGASPVIVVGDEGSPVKFDSGVSLLGSAGAGARFEYDPARVTTPFIIPVFFSIVVS